MDPLNQDATDYIAKAIDALEHQASNDDVAATESSAPKPAGAAAATAAPAVYEIPRNTAQSRTLYSRGLVLYSQGNLKEASLMWERAVQYDSKNVLARNAFNRAQIEMRESR
jgi:tetratricopeptide (TPR) repeat protein